MFRRLLIAAALVAAVFALAPTVPASAQTGSVFVDASAGGANTGTSWTNAYTDLSTALANANSGDRVWVAQGSYTPDAVDQTASFNIPAGVAVYGGFDGTEALLSERDPAQFATILSGEINSGVDFDNTENIVVFNNADGARLDGVVVTGGFADGATPDGAGVRVINSSAVVIANTRVANSEADMSGGAVYIGSSTAVLISSQLDTSSATTGGALASVGSDVVMTNSLVFLNSAANALTFESSSDAFLTNVTVADNTTTGAAVNTASGSSAVLTNAIVHDNGSASFSGLATSATFSNIEGGAIGAGNIDADPLFESGFTYRLGFGSPSINVGSDVAVPQDVFDIDDDGDAAEPTPDLHRQTRIDEGTVDHGAIESVFCPSSLHVDASNTALNQTGLTWADAFSDLQDALAITSLCGGEQLVEVRIAAGTYTPTDSGLERATSFEVVSRTTLQGGFAPGGSASPDPDAFLTVLSGDVQGNDGTITDISHPNRSENSYRVVVADGFFIKLKGLRIQGGNADGPSAAERAGAGITINATSGVELRQVEIRRNAAEDGGGGAFVSAVGSASVVIVDSLILQNEAPLGGGVALAQGELAVANSNIRLNVADTGGGFWVSNGSADFRNVQVTENEANVGGGIFLDDGTITTMLMSTVADNVAQDEGGAFGGSGSPFSLHVSNSVIWGNQADQGPSFSGVNNRNVSYSTIEGGEPGVGNLDTDPQFVGTTNYRLKDSSPSIDAGLFSLLPLDVFDVDDANGTFEFHPVDLDSAPRLAGIAVDHGAYESATGSSCGNGTTIHVDNSNDSFEDGVTWATAYTDLQTALANADACPQVEEILIAEGTYTPFAPTSAGRSVHFTIRGDLTVIGGYKATGSPASDPEIYETILSGDLAGDDSGAISFNDVTRWENSLLVVELADDGMAPTELINLTIADGSNERPFDSTASGIHLRQGSLINVRLERNVARQNGSAMFAPNPQGVRLINSTVTNNGPRPALELRTGFFTGSDPTPSDVELVNTTISDNEGGSIRLNTVNEGIDLLAVNSLIADNQGPIEVDGIAQVSMRFANSTIANNELFGDGEVIGTTTGSTLELENSILWNDGDGFVQSEAPNVVASASASSVSGGTITGSIDVDPEFIDPSAGNYRLAGSSDLINDGNNSLIAADTADLDNDGNTAEDTPIDLDGNGRVRNGTVDIGAFEAIADKLTVLPKPCVIYSSKAANGAIGGPFVGGEQRTIDVTGTLSGQGGDASCVPNGATLAYVTITAVDPQVTGNLRLSETGVAPTGGVVNFAGNGLFNSNTVAVPLGNSGAVDVFANGLAQDIGHPSTGVRVAVLAYADESGEESFVPITPCAAHDSRDTQGSNAGWEGPFGPGGGPDEIDVVGVFDPDQGGGNQTCNIPEEATAVLTNLVAVRPGGDTGALSLSPAGGVHNEPQTNFTVLSQTMNNATTVLVPLDGGEEVQIAIDGEADAFTDTRLVILGYTTGKDGSRLVPVDACSAFDTRSTAGATGAFSGKRLGSQATTYQISGAIPAAQGGGNGGTCMVPDSATAVLVNLVAIQADRVGNLQAYATGTTPTGGVLNFTNLTPPMNNSNAVIVPLSGNGELTVNVNAGAGGAGQSTTHIRGVILGYLD